METSKTLKKGVLIIFLVASTYSILAQYAIGEFQVGVGTQIGGHVLTKNNGPTGFESADFDSKFGYYAGYNHQINGLFSIGLTYQSLKGQINRSTTANPPISADFSGMWWSASGIAISAQASTNRYKVLSAHGLLSFSNRVYRSDEKGNFQEIFGEDSFKVTSIYVGVGINWNVSRSISINLIDFYVGNASASVSQYDGGLLNIGYLKSGVNIRIIKK